MSLVVLLPKPSTIEYFPELHGEIVENQAVRALKQPKVDKVTRRVVKTVMVVYGSNCNQIRRWLVGMGMGGSELNYALQVINRESGCNNLAQNPTSTAFGLGQFLDSTWATVGCVKTRDAYKQLICTRRYVTQRYGGSWYKAHLSHQSRGWY